MFEELAKDRSVKLIGIPGHRGVIGDEQTNQQAKLKAKKSFTGQSKL